jgi:hypothetical protein
MAMLSVFAVILGAAIDGQLLMFGNLLPINAIDIIHNPAYIPVFLCCMKMFEALAKIFKSTLAISVLMSRVLQIPPQVHSKFHLFLGWFSNWF